MERRDESAAVPEEGAADMEAVQIDEADPLADGGMIGDEDVEQVIELDGTSFFIRGNSKWKSSFLYGGL